MTFLTGRGDNILGLGTDSNVVTLGAGHNTVFANSSSTHNIITIGSGSADIVIGGVHTTLRPKATAADRTLTLFGFDPARAQIELLGYGTDAAAVAKASQVNSGGSTVMQLADRTTIIFVGTGRVDGYSLI